MTKHTWTPDAVHELVKDWPDEARAAIGWAPGEHQWVQLDGSQLSADLAAAAHVASGLEWWAARNKLLTIRQRPSAVAFCFGTYTQPGAWYRGPTLLHAVSAAIMAAGVGK